MPREAIPDRRVGQRYAMALGDRHLQPLAPALQQGGKLLGHLAWPWTGRGVHRRSNARENTRLEGLGFGQWPRSLGTIPDVAGVHPRHGPFGHGPGGHRGALPAPGRFERQQRGL